MERFTNKIAVVTGSGSGIGASITKKFIQRGLIVVGLDKKYEKLQELDKEIAQPGRFHFLKCDVTKEDEIRSTFERIVSELGPVHVLVNNAGIGENFFLTEISSDLISKIFDTNVKATILCAQQAVKIMTENLIEGHIINIDSIAGHYILSKSSNFGDPNKFSTYTSSKHAVKVISESLRRELVDKKSNIKVTNLSPGRVNTILTKSLPAVDPEKGQLQPDDIANACICVLDTRTEVNISELTVLPLYQPM